MGWVGLGEEKWTHAHLWGHIVGGHLLMYLYLIVLHNIANNYYAAVATDLLFIDWLILLVLQHNVLDLHNK